MSLNLVHPDTLLERFLKRIILRNIFLSIFVRFINERELSLYDGTRLLHHERYQLIKEYNGWSDEEMATR